MSQMLYDILIPCKTDIKHLVQVKRYLENSVKRKTAIILTMEEVKTISTIVSTIYSLQHHESEYMEIIIDTLLYAVKNKNNKFGQIESELGNLTLKILMCIEHNAKFHVLFCKLLSFINLMCSYSINVWQLLARPVLNIFINKKFEHAYMEEALREFSNISRNSKPSELVRVIKQNQDIAKGFSMLVRSYGDFIVQMNILELLYSFKGCDESLMKTVFCCGNQETSELLKYLTFSHFRKDSRIFLNAFNKSLGSGKKVFSLKCSTFYFGNSELSPPKGVEGIWMDLNQDSKRISIFCADYTLKPKTTYSDILQLPVTDVERIKLKFNTISSEHFYCIMMKIRCTSEVCDFKVGSKVICKALVSVNQRKEVLDFTKAIEELSDKIQSYRKMKTNEISNSGDSLSQDSRTEQLKSPVRETNTRRVKISTTSPLIFTSKDRNENKQLSLSQTSYASSIFSGRKELNTEEKFDTNLNMNSMRNRFQENTNGRKKLSGDPKLQVNQISSSVLESQRLTLDSSFNSSISSQVSVRKDNFCNKWGDWNNIQVDKNDSGKDIRKKLLSDIQNAIRISSHDKIIKTDDNNNNNNNNINNNTKNNKERDQIKRNYSCRTYEEWTSSFDDSISAEIRITESNKENLPETLNTSVLPEKKFFNRTHEVNLVQQNKKLKQNKEKKEEIHRPSLLDPNGYSYKRWQLQTTSERSNYWTKKLKGNEANASKPMKDVFHFSEEEDDSDGSNVFKKKKRKTKRTNSTYKEKNEVQRRGFQITDDKTIKNNTRRTRTKKCNFQQKAIVDREPQLSIRRTGKYKDRLLVRTLDNKNVTRDEYTAKQDHRFEELHNSSFFQSFSSNYDDLILKQKPKYNNYSSSESFLSVTSKKRESREKKTTEISIVLSQKLEEIESEIWKSMSNFYEEIKKREEKEFTKYLNMVEGIMNRLAEEEEETQKRLIRLEKCVDYFRLGASVGEINIKSQKEMENLVEELKIIFGSKKSNKTDMRVNECLESVKDKLLEKVEGVIDKTRRNHSINALESYLSECST